MKMRKIFFLLVVSCIPFGAKANSPYPLRCGIYLVSSSVKISSQTGLELVGLPNSFSETMIRISLKDVELGGQLIEGSKMWLSSKIKLVKKKSSYEFEAQFFGKPILSPIELIPDFEPVIRLEKDTPCE